MVDVATPKGNIEFAAPVGGSRTMGDVDRFLNLPGRRDDRIVKGQRAMALMMDTPKCFAKEILWLPNVWS
jgi:hypothetical protein